MHQPVGPGIGSALGVECIDAFMADVVRDTGASICLLFLLPPGERVLQLVLVSGISRQLAAPWARIRMDASSPVVDAMHHRHLVWLGNQEEMARRYPHEGIVLPYDFMLAAVPLIGGTLVWGGIVLAWPVSHSPQLSPQERDAATTCCRNVADLLEQAADHGRPLLLPEEPRFLPPSPKAADLPQAMAALDFTERLLVGCWALDLDGRLTFINSAGADLVGASAASLMGNRPWEVLPWLRDSLTEDRYRSAVITRQPTSFIAMCPPATPLLFQLYPSDSGISIHLAPAVQQEITTPQQAHSANRSAQWLCTT
ncbi:PAS domain-containing protein [Streptomyces sp. NPDC096354]|uniref:PAS domain-containing protein n=1 Tax=Streptomyces sp. NPDC096354 TaxID=3366088 RepID=UPI00380F21D9